MLDPYISPLLLQLKHIKHGFFDRRGGVSVSPWDTLNTCLLQGDSPNHVIENRTRIADYFNTPADKLFILKQTHSVDIVINPSDHNGAGDALITTQSGMVLGVKTADCVPVLISDKELPLIAAVHAGWRGTIDGIVPKVVKAMYELGAKHLYAVIGPCIRQETYEVGDDVAKLVDPQFIKPTGKEKWLLDKSGLITSQLQNLGVTEIQDCRINTFTNLNYFSHRRSSADGNKGRQLSCIALT